MILELRRAQIAERGVESAGVIDLIDNGIARATCPPVTPEQLFEGNHVPTFGVFHDIAQRVAKASIRDIGAWGAAFFTRVVQDATAARALMAIIAQRNNLAHGRQSLPLAGIKNLLTQGLHLESWEQIPQADGELRPLDWQP
jgi:hypothetical protein